VTRKDDMADEFEAAMTWAERKQAELDEMNRTYEALDQAEYEEFMAELDARDAERGQRN
jgi:hypothetical protein